jgi:MFS family permease
MHCAKCYFFETAVGDEVCNRCGRAYLPEANVYLGLAVFVTAGLAWSLRALLTASVDPFVRPALDVGAWVTWPVSIIERPAYGLVIGAFLAMLAVAPILTGVLYGKRGGWLLVLVIAAVGPSRLGGSPITFVLPTAVFAGVLALGVWIAAGYTLRLRSRLAGALLGLIPAAAYWFIATAASDTSAVASVLWGVVYVAPVAAVGFSAAAVALVVAVGWADKWHVRWPGALLAVLAAGPILALLAFVGMDEVRYGFLKRPVGAAPSVPPLKEYCEFLSRYPSSRRSAEIRADLAAQLTRLGPARLRQGEARPEGFPAARQVWQEILARNPDSRWAMDAQRHLGDADAADGLFAEAERQYRAALDRTAGLEVPDVDPLADFTVLGHLLTVGDALEVCNRANHLQAVRQEVLLHLAILEENHRPTPAGTRALALFFRAFALKGTNAYRSALVEAREADPEGALADNIAFRLAMFEADEVKRIEQLNRVAEAHPGTDGAMQARLAAAEGLIVRAASDPGSWRRARDELMRVRDELDRRRARDPQDLYVAAFADRVGKKMAYVEAQLREPPPAGAG